MPSFIVTSSDWLSAAQTTSAIQAPFIGKDRIAAGSPPDAGATARPRGAMIPVPPLVVTKARCRPSGENCGCTFMPARLTMARVAPLAIVTASMRVAYGARKPEVGDEA